MVNGPPKSLIERVGGRQAPAPNDAIQARIDSIVGASAPPAYPGQEQLNAMQMAAASNPLLLQEMMMNQMAMMAAMGMMNPAAFGVPTDMGMYGPRPNGGMQGATLPQQGRRPPRDKGTGPGRPKPAPSSSEPTTSTAIVTNHPQPLAIASPTPTPAMPPAAESSVAGVIPPDRPQSPTLCKFGLKCTNAWCRYSHPSPVATAESGIVLSNEPCENGKACADKDCVKGHVSPAALNAGKNHPLPLAQT